MEVSTNLLDWFPEIFNADIFGSTMFMVFRNTWAYIFNDDPEVVALVAAILPVVSLFQVFDGLGAVTGGILRAMGKQVRPSCLPISLHRHFKHDRRCRSSHRPKPSYHHSPPHQIHRSFISIFIIHSSPAPFSTCPPTTSSVSPSESGSRSAEV